MKVKICGLTETNQIETCIKYGASMCGFVMFYPQSHRNLSLDKAKELTSINNVKPNQRENIYKNYRKKYCSPEH